MSLIVSTFFLTFRMNKKAYILLCNVCHVGCNKLCMLTATKFMLPKSEGSEESNFGGSVATTTIADLYINNANTANNEQTTTELVTITNDTAITAAPESKQVQSIQ
eukprot:UN06291